MREGTADLRNVRSSRNAFMSRNNSAVFGSSEVEGRWEREGGREGGRKTREERKRERDGRTEGGGGCFDRLR